MGINKEENEARFKKAVLPIKVTYIMSFELHSSPQGQKFKRI